MRQAVDAVQRANLVEVEPGRREQVVAGVVLLLEHPADEREAVRMDAGGGEADHDVAFTDRRAVDETLAVDEPDAGPGEVELVVAVDPGQLGGLAAEQCDAGGAADLGGTFDQLRDLVQRDPVRGDVVEEEERVGARRQHVVDAVRREVGAAGAQRAALAREDQLRPDAVGRGREQAPVVERVEPGERAEAGGPGGLDGRPKPLDDRIGGREGHSGGRVRPFLHLWASLIGGNAVTAFTGHSCRSPSSRSRYWRRARRWLARGAPVPGWRQASFALGITLAAAAQLMPLEDELFFVHMLQHVMLGDLAALAFVLGLTGPLLRPILPWPWLAPLRHLAHPLVALPLWAVSLYLWHLPTLYEAAVEHRPSTRSSTCPSSRPAC